MKVAYLIEPPFNYLNERGVVTGYDVELARHVLQELGIAGVEFVETEFAKLLPGLARNDWQMTTGLIATRERQQQASFSRPIWALPDGLLIRVTDADRVSGYRSLSNTPDQKVAVVQDQVQHLTALEFGVTQDRILIFETYADAAHAVQDGLADAFASVGRAHQGFLQQKHAQDLTVVDVLPFERPPACGCFAFAQTAAKLRELVDQILITFIGGAEHLHLMKQFGFEDDEVDRLQQSGDWNKCLL